jgi:hypothetical protein
MQGDGQTHRGVTPGHPSPAHPTPYARRLWDVRILRCHRDSKNIRSAFLPAPPADANSLTGESQTRPPKMPSEFCQIQDGKRKTHDTTTQNKKPSIIVIVIIKVEGISSNHLSIVVVWDSFNKNSINQSYLLVTSTTAIKSTYAASNHGRRK